MELNLNYEPEVLVETSDLKEEEWLNYRRLGIGGSDVAAIMGQSPFCTTRDLYFDKIGKKPVIQEETNWVALEVGHRLESLVAEIFSKKLGLEVFSVPKMFRHPLYPFMLADIDFIIQFSDGKTGILETKTTNYNCRDKWDNDSVPLNYEMQGRHYMSVLNLDVVYFACLYGNNENEFIVRRMDRDLDIEADLIESEAYFWNEYVQKKIEPPYTEKADLVLQSIRKHCGHGVKDDNLLELDRKYEDTLEEYLKLKQEKQKVDAESKRLEEQMKQKSLPIIERLGSRCLASLKGKNEYSITYNPSYRTGINKMSLERLKVLNPAIYAEYVTTTESSKFQCKKM